MIHPKVSSDTHSIKALPERDVIFTPMLTSFAPAHKLPLLAQTEKKVQKSFFIEKIGKQETISSSCSVNKDSSRCEFAKSSTSPRKKIRFVSEKGFSNRIKNDVIEKKFHNNDRENHLQKRNYRHGACFEWFLGDLIYKCNKIRIQS